MKLKNLVNCWIYELETTKKDGETSKKWKYKDCKRLNVQQDINELDRNSAGLIDYDKIKIRNDCSISLNKNDGISLSELELDENSYTLKSPQYKVVSCTKVGKSTTYTCEIYHGE